jgi:hypothetical protein
MPWQAYLEKFQNAIDVLEHCGGSIGHWTGTSAEMNIWCWKPTVMIPMLQPWKQCGSKKASQEQYLAMAFLLGCDRNRYGKLIENLENDFTQDCYLKTVTSTYSLLTNWWKQDAWNIMRILGPTNDGISFTNIDGNDEGALALNMNG